MKKKSIQDKRKVPETNLQAMIVTWKLVKAYLK